jgi:hypothetical protein
MAHVVSTDELREEIDVEIDIDAIETQAKAATQGKWFHRTAPGRQGFVQVDVPGTRMAYGLELLCDDYTGYGDDEQRELDCAFVAAVNPDVILELIRRLRIAESDDGARVVLATSRSASNLVQIAVTRELAGKGITLNPMALFADEPDTCMELAQQAAMVNLPHDDLELAKSIGLRIAESQTPSVRALVEAWKQEPTLADFAAAVARAMLPN